MPVGTLVINIAKMDVKELQLILFENYLTNRKQIVNINITVSFPATMAFHKEVFGSYNVPGFHK